MKATDSQAENRAKNHLATFKEMAWWRGFENPSYQGVRGTLAQSPPACPADTRQTLRLARSLSTLRTRADQGFSLFHFIRTQDTLDPWV